MSKSNKYFIISSILFCLFILFTIVIKLVGVKGVGPNGSEIGFADLNKSFFDSFGINNGAKIVSEIIGYFAIVCALFFVGLLIFEWIKRKSFKLVDKNLIVFCVMCLILACFYIFFEIVKINYRPIIVDGELKASYPSSHTMLICSLLVFCMLNFKFYVQNTKIRYTLYACFASLVIVGTICRLYSGMHWLTDIFAGVILSGALCFLFAGVLNLLSEKIIQKSEEYKK
ncbi:MAG: phosphatase PAP2 family protein [Clostridia bacterium]|nr:phosphatase PAP2 family protein [Clostridia bacterium]